MYKIYTSYFSNKKLPEDIQKIPICSKILSPGNYATYYKELAPNASDVRDLYNQNITEVEFSLNYLNKLERIGEDRSLDLIVQDLELRLEYSDIVLLCYEKPNKFCHRHILAQFLKKNYDFQIEEF